MAGARPQAPMTVATLLSGGGTDKTEGRDFDTPLASVLIIETPFNFVCRRGFLTVIDSAVNLEDDDCRQQAPSGLGIAA